MQPEKDDLTLLEDDLSFWVVEQPEEPSTKAQAHPPSTLVSKIRETVSHFGYRLVHGAAHTDWKKFVVDTAVTKGFYVLLTPVGATAAVFGYSFLGTDAVTDENERLKVENERLKRENKALRAQLEASKPFTAAFTLEETQALALAEALEEGLTPPPKPKKSAIS